MIVISNKQRDDIVRYLEFLCGRVKDDDLRMINTKRLAGTLVRKLREKKPLSDYDMLPPL